jgi:rhodanese-related sulfurtransferase
MVEDEDFPEPSVEVEAEVAADVPALTVHEVAARLGQPGFHVYDTNSPARWRRSHVAGAKNLDGYDFERSALPEDTSATLVFYCSGPG